jgi:hypothetical protein
MSRGPGAAWSFSEEAGSLGRDARFPSQQGISPLCKVKPQPGIKIANVSIKLRMVLSLIIFFLYRFTF